MVLGIACALGDTLTARHFCGLVLQLLLAVTQTFPPEVANVTVMDVVPCPAVILAPAGTVHA